MVKKKISTERILGKKIIRSFKENWKNFVAIIAISFLAVALFSGLTANYKSLQKRVDKLYREGNIADIFLTLNEYEEADLTAVSNMEGVDDLEVRTLLPGNSQNRSFNWLINDEDNRISIPSEVEGTDDFLLDKNFAKSLDLTDNQFDFSLTNIFLSFAQENADIINENLLPMQDNILLQEKINLTATISGTMRHPEAVENSQFGTGIAYCSYLTAIHMILDTIGAYYSSELTQMISLLLNKNLMGNQIIVKTAQEEQVMASIDSYFQQKTKNNLLISLTRDKMPGNVGIQSDIEQAQKLTYVFPVIFFLVSVLVILTTLSQMIAKERTQIGTMKAIGINKRDIFWHYISYGVFLTLIGAVLGLIAGPLFIPSVMNIKYALLWSLPATFPSIITFEGCLCLLALVGLSGLVSFFVVRKEINLRPVESLRPASPKSFKNKNNKLPLLNKVSLPTRMAYRNITRNKAKSTMVVLGTLGCTALLVCGFGIMDSLNYGIDVDLKKTLPFDISLSYSTSDVSTVNEQILTLDGVQTVETYLATPAKLQGTNMSESTLYLLDDESQVFTKPYNGDGVAISQGVADNLKSKVGDTLSLIVNGQKYDKRINEIFASCFVNGVYDMKSHYEQFQNIPDNKGWVITDDFSLNESIAEKMENIEGISSLITNRQQKEYADDLLSSIRNMTLVIEVFAILLAVVVIFNLANLNVKERTRDIATLKVLGFNRYEISKTLIMEIMALTILGTFVGLFLGFPMCVLVMSINKTQLMTFLYHVAPLSYLYATLLSLGTALIINTWIMRRANRIKMVESLKSVE